MTEYSGGMTLTPTPIPRCFFAVCDHCHKSDIVDEDHHIPDGWWEVMVHGYVGSFLACSLDCEEALRTSFDKGGNDASSHHK